MLRDSKFSRKSLGNREEEEIENMSTSSKDSNLSHEANTDSSSRAPLVVIQDPASNPKHELPSSCRGKVEKTPTKSKVVKVPDPKLPLHTPERQGIKKFGGMMQKYDSCSNDGNEDFRSDLGTTTKLSRVNRNGGLMFMTPRTTGISTQITPTKSVGRPPISTFKSKIDGGLRAGNFSSVCRGMSSVGSNPDVNTIRVPHFDLRDDPVFWMDHSVQVLIRLRPLNNMEKNINGYRRCLKQDSAQSITWIGQPETRFTFDHVACESINQETLFEMTGMQMVENCLSGYNSCIFAYGQTGSGKTYTMLGDIQDLEAKPSPDRGMTPRIFEFLFTRIHAEEESRINEKLIYNCKCSFLEIYNEQITDLLDPSSTNLMLREDAKKGIYVENLSEFEVQNEHDILKLLTQGSSNRKVAATNMNRESSRSHSVFTCVIESRWEKDSTTNFRFARLNLVDLAGSERQKTSGADGERLKEAANINKSLSTLGHVIMILVEVAQGKPRHIPYRDSRLTFLLQDSLGGNSKTMIIANVSPSTSCAAETLNTLKFAQRAKLIQNNAVINEDSTGDVAALQHQIRLLKEELFVVKHQNIPRALSFGSTETNEVNNTLRDNANDMGKLHNNDFAGYESRGSVRMSSKQLKSLEITLAGALRREQMADTSIRKLEAQIEQLNRLVRQREEDSRSAKMMLKFREDKIQRLESLVRSSIPADSFLKEENKALLEEIQLLQAKIDKNPEITRFALENIRSLEQLRRYQEFYDEGERDILLAEISNLKNQVLRFIDDSTDESNCTKLHAQSQEGIRISNENSFLHEELKNTVSELEECRCNLTSCLEDNAKLSREIHDLRSVMDRVKTSLPEEDDQAKSMKDADDIILSIRKQYEDAQNELNQMKLNVEALELQQILSTKEIEDLRKSNERYLKLLHEKQTENAALKGKYCTQDLDDRPPSDRYDSNNFFIESKFKRMQDSLDTAKRLNMLYQNDRASQASNEVQMDEVSRQAEAATAEVIVCLQNELDSLQKEVQNCQSREIETKREFFILEDELKNVRDNLNCITEDNKLLFSQLKEKDAELQSLTGEWELLTSEIEEFLVNGHESLTDASNQVALISSSFPEKRIWISEQVGSFVRIIAEKELLIKELGKCLENANNKRQDVECNLKSLRQAVLVINEAEQQDCKEKEKEIFLLTSELSAKTSTISELEDKIKLNECLMSRASLCATAAFVAVSRLTEVNSENIDALKQRDTQLSDLAETIQKKDGLLNSQADTIKQADKQIQLLMEEVEGLMKRLSEEEEQHASRECVELEMDYLKIQAMQKEVELHCILAKFEEAQNTMRETDIMINKLMIANETMKLGQERQRQVQTTLLSERDALTNKVEELESVNHLKDQQVEKLENLFGSNLVETNNQIIELEGIVIELQDNFAKNLLAIAEEGHCMKSLLLESRRLVKSSLEDIWSGIFTKDCAVSVLHLCHMGIVLETVTGLNAENGLLQNGVCQSNAVIAELREKNIKSRIELETCKNLKGKLLADIKNSLDRITRKEEETIEFGNRLSIFETHISDLQFQEELMLQRSNCIGSDLAVLMKELDLSNANLTAYSLDQEKLLKDKDVLLNSQGESFTLSMFSKDIELFILKSRLEETACNLTDSEADAFNLEKLLNDRDELLNSQGESFTLSMFSKDIELFILKSRLEETACNLTDSEADAFNLEKLLNDRDELLNSQGDSFTLSMFSKDIELFILQSRLEETACNLRASESDAFNQRNILENLKTEFIVSKVDEEFKEQYIASTEIEATLAEAAANLLQAEMKELDLSNANLAAYSLDQEKLLKHKDELLNSQGESFILSMFSKDIELFILKSRVEETACNLTDSEADASKLRNILEKLKTELIVSKVDEEFKGQYIASRETEATLAEATANELQAEMKELDISNAKLAAYSLDQEKLLKDKDELMDSQGESFTLHMFSNDIELFILKSRLQEMACNFMDSEADAFKHRNILENLKTEFVVSKVDGELKEQYIASREMEAALAEATANELQAEMKVLLSKLDHTCLKFRQLNEAHDSLKQDLKLLVDVASSNDMLRCGLEKAMDTNVELLNQIQELKAGQEKLLDGLKIKERETEISLLCDNIDRLSNVTDELEYFECRVKELVSENLTLHNDLLRKDEVLDGILFDFRLLQESASNSMDQKVEIDELVNHLETAQEELALRSSEMEEAVDRNRVLELQLQEKIESISTLEHYISEERESLKLVSSENSVLRVQTKDTLAAKCLLEETVKEKNKAIKSMELELTDMGNALDKMNATIDCLRSSVDEISNERDHLRQVVLGLNERLEKMDGDVKRSEAIALEAQQTAESRKMYAEEREAEVKLLETSVEELEYTINVLEKKIDVVKGEAERQRLQREELESELQTVDQQMQNFRNISTDMKRHLDEKEKELHEALSGAQLLERSIGDKNTEIAQLKAHLSELTLHAEAQAGECKQKFKALEAMAEQVKPESHVSHAISSSSSKLEKNAAKSRGSGSPFKCMGLGLVHQIKSEKDEELMAARLRIEELESAAATRQKEMFALNARLAAADSMTHDVIRDLLGLKLDMTSYASLLDNQQLQKIAEKAQLINSGSQFKEPDMIKIKQQLYTFIEERQGWLDEIDRKHAELLAAQLDIEKLRQREQSLSSENEMLRMEGKSYKMKVSELEGEIKKLSGQQNLQQRIHHHAKIKEENNMLKTKNEDLSIKLRRAQTVISRAKEEVALFRATVGKCENINFDNINFDEEQRLNNRLREIEEDRLQLAQKLLGLCTSVLKAAGITSPVSDINPAIAEEALEQLKTKLISAEREIQNLKLKYRIASERNRLSELMPQSSPVSASTDEKSPTSRRVSQHAPFLSALDR